MAVRVVVVVGRDQVAAEQLVRGLDPRAGLALVFALSDTRGLAKRLREVNRLPVIEVHKSMLIEGEHIYVLPKDRDITIDKDRLMLGHQDGSMSRDRLLRSLGDSLGADAVAVVLGGTGTDGVLGAKRVKEAGGVTVCQLAGEEDSELPRMASATGTIDLALPPVEIGPRLSALANGAPSPDDPAALAAVDEIVEFASARSGLDFRTYRADVLRRRLARRMQITQIGSPAAYARFLREHPLELQQLVRDFLLRVTDFFRDADAFTALERDIIPALFHGKRPTDQVRVWVVGCVTGEEVYSIAMLLREHLARLRDPPSLQLLATDIDAEALREARAGYYPRAIAADVSQDRLSRFFTAENEQYRVGDQLRNITLFSRHDLLRDPPFGRIDLVCCRGLLDQLHAGACERAVALFQYALQPAGYLLVGAANQITSDRFTAVAHAPGVYRREVGSGAQSWPDASVVESYKPAAIEVDQQLVEHYAPATVLVDDRLDVIHASPRASLYLRGAVSDRSGRGLLQLVPLPLRAALEGAIDAARETGRGTTTRVVQFEDGGLARAVELRVRLDRTPDDIGQVLMITFDELAIADEHEAVSHANVEQLERELDIARQQLRSTVWHYETAMSELRASNAALHAISDQFHAVTSEVDAGREELNAMNEELLILNHELMGKVADVSRANRDLQALVASPDLAAVFLDEKLAIERFTPGAQNLFNVLATDVGRPLVQLTHKLEPNDLVDAAGHVFATAQSADREVRSVSGRQFLARISPCRSPSDQVDGVVLAFMDITELRLTEAALQRSEASLRTTEEQLAAALRSAPVALIAHAADLSVTWGYVNGKELSGDLSSVFTSDRADEYSRIVREVMSSGSRARVEIELKIDEHLEPYEFQIEPTVTGGVTSVGICTSRSRSPS